MSSHRRPRARAVAPRVPGRWAVVLAVVGLLASCSGDDDTSSAPGASSGTVALATLPPVASTSPPTPAPPASTAAASTASPATPASTTTPTTVAPSTTASTSTTSITSITSTTVRPSAPAAPCDLDLVVEQTQTVYEGITPSDLACADGWAAWIGRPDDQFADGFFAVARWGGNSWELMNLGTAGVCADAGVPDEIWDELGCFE